MNGGLEQLKYLILQSSRYMFSLTGYFVGEPGEQKGPSFKQMFYGYTILVVACMVYML